MLGLSLPSRRCKESDLSQVEAAIPTAVSSFLEKHGKAGANCVVTVAAVAGCRIAVTVLWVLQVNKGAWLPASE